MLTRAFALSLLAAVTLIVHAGDPPPCHTVKSTVPQLDPVELPAELTDFKGTWEGEFHPSTGKGLYSECVWGHTLRVEFGTQSTAIVSFLWNDEWKVFDEAAQVTQLSTNVVISASHAKPAGNWVETWTLVLTREEAGTIVGTWNRVVNN